MTVSSFSASRKATLRNGLGASLAIHLRRAFLRSTREEHAGTYGRVTLIVNGPTAPGANPLMLSRYTPAPGTTVVLIDD